MDNRKILAVGSIALSALLFFFLPVLVSRAAPEPVPAPAAAAPPPNGMAGAEIGPTPAILTSPGIKIDLHSSAQLDYYGFDADEQYIAGAGSQENNFSIRRARVTLRGKLWDAFGFYLQMALEIPADPLIDAAITIPVVPGLDFQAGKLKLPFSEERLKSYATHQPFMERSLAASLELRRSQGVLLAAHSGNGALSLYFGCFTGEPMSAPNTDDDFEYVGRAVFHLDPKVRADVPGSFSLAGSAARGRRSPVRSATTSFPGKTMNELTFFSPVPVAGYRTRYEADIEWRYQTLWLAAEWIGSQEERDQVRIDLDTDGDGAREESVKRDLDPLDEQGFMAYLVWVMTGEPASANIAPTGRYGALALAIRYATVTFTGQDRIRSSAGTWGREVSVASTALGRRSINETARDLYVGLDWTLKPGVFIQFAADWQWFDESSPVLDHPDVHVDVNYRARVGMTF